jgi:hypothetical protein
MGFVRWPCLSSIRGLTISKGHLVKTRQVRGEETEVCMDPFIVHNVQSVQNVLFLPYCISSLSSKVLITSIVLLFNGNSALYSSITLLCSNG